MVKPAPSIRFLFNETEKGWENNMKVIAINGSPRAKGNTACALETAAEALRNEGIEVELLHVGHRLIHGCIACGKCVESCKFGAIHLNEHGIAEVDEEKCIACGRCVRECPQHIIHLHDCANTIVVKCSNKDKGKDARTVCSVSCIGCGICEKTCTASAIHVEDNRCV